jgi:hypothetical protein
LSFIINKSVVNVKHHPSNMSDNKEKF